ncbi:MAG: RNA methyltransferase [Magnetovibrio sp.]|nr:RNA methyltransferase [Magnetovibrio sp.]
MKGYFGVGVEGISKSMNAGAIFRTAHAFGASFVFAVAAQYKRQSNGGSDTAKSLGQLPFYGFPSIEEMLLPKNCRMVGVELSDDAIDMPSFRHPSQCAYVLGPERGSLSAQMVEKCDFILKIPTSFCINVSVAAALVMYDRTLSMGRFAERPVRAGGPTEALPVHVSGGPVLRTLKPYRQAPPLGDGFDPEGYNTPLKR